MHFPILYDYLKTTGPSCPAVTCGCTILYFAILIPIIYNKFHFSQYFFIFHIFLNILRNFTLFLCNFIQMSYYKEYNHILYMTAFIIDNIWKKINGGFRKLGNLSIPCPGIPWEFLLAASIISVYSSCCVTGKKFSIR